MFLPTIEYSVKHVAEHEITYFEYLLSDAITLIADYLDKSREDAIVYILEKYDVEDIKSAVLQMIIYMYADAASELESLGSKILAR